MRHLHPVRLLFQVDYVIFTDEDTTAYRGNVAQYLVAPPHALQHRPSCLIDARHHSVLHSWDALDTCTDCRITGTGGNLKIGKIRYGNLQQCLDLRREDGLCYLENKYVRVLNNNFTYNLTDDAGPGDTPVASYNCDEIDDQVNGAFSPLLDAAFYGTAVGRMFEDWYGLLPFGEATVFRVHYGVNQLAAFYNGYECTFGDGDGQRYHPLVTLNIVGHEVAHGFTERNSGLYYYQQWGGIDEAFSDMTGEVAEAYLAEADWLIGSDAVMGSGPPFRFFEHPEKDNHSISHADNFTDFMDVHYSSGVYNRAFFLLVNEHSIPIKDAYHAFLYANMLYWHHMSNFDHAACDVLKAAYDLGQDGAPYRLAFAQVGVKTCNVEDHVVGLRKGEVYSNITVSRCASPTFVFSVPGQFAESVTVSANSSGGEVNVTLSDRVWGSEDQAVLVYAQGQGSTSFEVPVNVSLHLTITLTTDADTPLKDVTLEATFTCVSEFTPDGSYEEMVLHWFWMACLSEEKESETAAEGEAGKEGSEE